MWKANQRKWYEHWVSPSAAKNGEARARVRRKERPRNLSSERATRRRYYHTNAMRVKFQRIKRAYNLNPEEYVALLDIQGGACFICRTALESGKSTHVDHCHETGLVRGLLCNSCNLALGHLKNSVPNATRLIEYLRNPPSRQLGIHACSFKKI